jgi:hypothetical protein
MSTRSTIKYREEIDGLPGFHLYDDLIDTFADTSEGYEPPVYLCLDSVHAEVQTRSEGGATVTVALPREMARALGLLPERSQT